MQKIIISEQAKTDVCGNPTTEAQAAGLGYVLTVPSDFSLAAYCYKLINGKAFYKRKDGKPIVAQQTVGGINYSGFYKASKDFIGVFEISTENNKLYAKFKIGKTELTKKTDTQFTGKILGTTYNVEFTIANNEATGGKINYSIAGIITETTFTRTSEGPEPVEELTWENVTKATWEALKKAGYWVKEEGGKLLAAIQNGLHVKKEEVNPFKCIDNWNEGWGYYKLLTGFEGDRRFAFEYTSHKVDGKKVKLLYFQDGDVVMRFTDSNKDVPGGKGKWSCEGQGYKIVWENGQVALFNREKGNVIDAEADLIGNTQQPSNLPTLSQVCKEILPCPSKSDVISGKKVYKLCMKCPEIKEIQDNPVFSKIYFRKLTENGKKQISDGIYGPITKAAVKEYQEMNGLVKDGIIGKNTITVLEKDKSGRR